jgi:hypothetical protein
MLALIEMNLLPGGKRGVARAKGPRKPAVPKFEGLREMIKGDPWVIGVVALAVLAALHVGFTFFTQGLSVNRIEEELAIQRQDSVRYAEAIAAADSLEARRDTLEQKMGIFRIDGMTGATYALTRFMRDLEDSPFIRDVRLVSQEQIQQGQRLVHNFVLMARYQVPDSTAIVTEPIILGGE